MMKLPLRQLAVLAAATMACSPNAPAGEVNIPLPDLHGVSFPVPGGALSGLTVLRADGAVRLLRGVPSWIIPEYRWWGCYFELLTSTPSLVDDILPNTW